VVRHTYAGRTPLLVLGALALLTTACQQTTKPAAPPASSVVPASDFQIKPVLEAFLRGIPPNWYLIPARDVAGTHPWVLDVRDPDEYGQGHIDGSMNVPLRSLVAKLDALPSQDRPLVVVCDNGHRSAIGMVVLHMLGRTAVSSLDGGLDGWRDAGLSLVTTPTPSQAGGPGAAVDPQLRAALDYFLAHTMPFTWGTIDGSQLTWDQSLVPQRDPISFDQGHSLLVAVDEPSEFAVLKASSAKLADAINLPLPSLTNILDRIPMKDFVTQVCLGSDQVSLEPKTLRYVTISTSSHRASIGMVTLQLLGYHFVNALRGDVRAWLATK
jgi:rhodanese-related sulfurtransferase